LIVFFRQLIDALDVSIDSGLILQIIGHGRVDLLGTEARELLSNLLRCESLVVVVDDAFDANAVAANADDVRALKVEIVFEIDWSLEFG
jgi:hypothetical protein